MDFDYGNDELERQKIKMLDRIGDGLAALCTTMFLCTALICIFG